MEMGERADVNYIYAKPTGALATMQAAFELKSEPDESLCLLLDAKGNEGSRSCGVEIKINETIVFSGSNGFPKLWRVRSFDIPQGVLKPGRNIITISNLEGVGIAGMPPWLMVSRCAIGPAGCLSNLVSFRKYTVSLPREARRIP
jgi:hypothetical protein